MTCDLPFASDNSKIPPVNSSTSREHCDGRVYEQMEEASMADHIAASNTTTSLPVRTKDCVSDVVTCSVGVPQGMVLSPLKYLFHQC